MSRLTRIIFYAVLASFIQAGYAYADDGPPWFEKVTVEFGITAILQGTSGNDVGESKDQTDYSFSGDLAFVGEIAEGHTLNLVFESGEGAGVTDNFDARSTPNQDAADTMGDPGVVTTVAQAYYEGEFMDGKFVFAAGKMDVHAMTDTNEYANDETAQFINGLFVRSVGVVFAGNDNGYVPAMAFMFQPSEAMSIAYTYSHNGGDDVFNKGHHWLEVGLHTNFGDLPGNYRFAYTQHDIDYTKISGGKSTNSGFNVSIDQALTENMGIFFRYASQDDSLVENEVTSAVSGGVSIGGAGWGRDDDTIGLAYGKINLNDSVVKEYNEGQSVMEAYYNFTVNEHLSLAADLQVINNLERAKNRDVTVFGMRVQAGF